MRFILASSSPRRKEILSYFLKSFEVVPPSFDEESVAFTGDPVAYVKTLSIGKAASLQKEYRGALILSADTTVYFSGKIFNKPKDSRHAHAMLSELSGQTHSVFTSVTAARDSESYTMHEETKVTFHPLNPSQIEMYVNSLPLMDKAGSYMIQGKGYIAIHKIEGCYCNVMGLPVHALKTVLTPFGINLWEKL